MLDSLGKILISSRVLFFFRPSFVRQIINRSKKNNDDVYFQSDNFSKKKLLVDVSVIHGHDAKTGIQRVVRGVLLELINNPPEDYDIYPVYASREHSYRYAKNFLSQMDNCHDLLDRKIIIHQGDIFLGLDLAAHVLPRYKFQLTDWKRQGVKIYFVVYDILPLTNPEWFLKSTNRNFKKWIKALAVLSDGAICISNSAKNDLEKWLADHFEIHKSLISMSTIPLGMDISATLPSSGVPEEVNLFLDQLTQRLSILMVGTVEPRKGYAQVIAAFEILWRQGVKVNLVIVGKGGWLTEALQDRLRNHVMKDICLWWLESASDELLERLYQNVNGVLVASEAEGFGLPLIEAIRYGLPIFARDIPVFREVSGDSAMYFKDTTPESFAESLKGWLSLIELGGVVVQKIPLVSWQDSAAHLVQYLGVDNPSLPLNES